MRDETLRAHLCGIVHVPFQSAQAVMLELMGKIYAMESDRLCQRSDSEINRSILIYEYEPVAANASHRDWRQRLEFFSASMHLRSAIPRRTNHDLLLPLLIHPYGDGQPNGNAVFCDTDCGIRVVNCSDRSIAVRSIGKLRSVVLDPTTMNEQSFAALWENRSSPTTILVLLPSGQDWGFPLGLDTSHPNANIFGPNSQAERMIRAALAAGAHNESRFCFTPIGPSDIGDDDSDDGAQPPEEPSPMPEVSLPQ